MTARGAALPIRGARPRPPTRAAVLPARAAVLPACATVLAAALGSACSGTVGTVDVELATAPGSHVLDAVERIRLTLTNPRRVVEATRSGGGFALSLELDAQDTTGALLVEGFDAQGALVAGGQSPSFPVSAINAHVVIYVAAPRSIGATPTALPGPRQELAMAALDYGAVLAGGRDAGGAPTTYLAIYNAYDHSLVEGLPLPAARAALAIAVGANRGVYLFGGSAGDGSPAGTLWRFDTNVAPSGAYAATTEYAGYARADARMIATGVEQFLVTGSPALTLASAALTARSDVTALPGAAASSTAGDAVPTALFAGASLVRFRQGAFDSLGAGRPDAAVAALPDGRFLVVGGGAPLTRDALVVDRAAGGAGGGSAGVTVLADALAIPRARPAVAATARHVLIAGGTDASGAVLASAELLDATTLAHLGTIPMLPHPTPVALALPNDQILLAGGALELFTPEPGAPGATSARADTPLR